MPSAGRRRTFINHTIRHEARFHTPRFQCPADPKIPRPLEPLSLAPYPSLTALPQASSPLLSPTNQCECGELLQILVGTDSNGNLSQPVTPRSSPSADSILGRRRRSSESPNQPWQRRTRPRMVYPVPEDYDPLSWPSGKNRRSSIVEDHASISPVVLLPDAAFNRRSGVPDVQSIGTARRAQDAQHSRGDVAPQEAPGVQRPTTENEQVELEGSRTEGTGEEGSDDGGCDRGNELQK